MFMKIIRPESFEVCLAGQWCVQSFLSTDQRVEHCERDLGEHC